MNDRSTPRRAGQLGAALVLAVVLNAGCGEDVEDLASPPASRTPASASPSASAAPTATPRWLTELRKDSAHYGGDYVDHDRVYIGEVPAGSLSATPPGREATAAGARFVTVRFPQATLQQVLESITDDRLDDYGLYLIAARIDPKSNQVSAEVGDIASNGQQPPAQSTVTSAQNALAQGRPGILTLTPSTGHLSPR